MTDEAKRVAAFCERVITAYKAYEECWGPESELIAELNTDDTDASTSQARECIRADKMPYIRQLHKARLEVYDLIAASHLPHKMFTVMFWRYNKCWTWSRIYKRLHLSKNQALLLRRQAFEKMVPYMNKMYPDWKPESKEDDEKLC